jgi:putative ABC transport system ATP-binding protein
MQESELILRLKGICKRYRTEEVETVALSGIDLDVHRGDFVSVMGPSGCGKSTLLNVMGMLDRPDDGSLTFLGSEMSGLGESEVARVRKRHIGFIFQNFNLIDHLSVQENVSLPLVYQRVKRDEIGRRVQAVMDRLGIAHRAGHFPGQLSGGQQQRVAIARALVSEPAMIFADEPTGNLDSEHGHDVMNLLRSLNDAGTTIVMVTHDASLGASTKTQVRLRDGRIDTAAAAAP